MKKNSRLSDYVVLRRRAIELDRLGRSQSYIAEALGVGQSTVSKWLSKYREQGEASLAYPIVGGSKRRINLEQQEELLKYLEQGAQAHGFEDDLWSRQRVRQVISQCFGIEYRVRAVGDLLRDLGYTLQKPISKSYRQDPERVRQWREEKLAQLKKNPSRKVM